MYLWSHNASHRALHFTVHAVSVCGPIILICDFGLVSAGRDVASSQSMDFSLSNCSSSVL